jgi:PAS domain-containing protein
MRTEDRRQTVRANGVAPAAPSALPVPLFAPEPRAEVTTDLEGVIRDVTPGAAALLCAEPGFLRGTRLRSLVRHDDLPRLEVLLSGEPANDGAHVRLAVPGGRRVGAELTVTAARDPSGRVTGLRWRVHERRADPPAESPAAAALRHRLERLVEAGHGVCLVDREGLVTWAGDAALEILGRPGADMVGSRWEELAPETADGPVSLALRRGREGSGTFARVAQGNDSVTAVDYVVAPLIEDDGVVGVALAFSEVGP